MPSRKYDYDAIIIGAGIGGLVCGCYLAKAGLKTLIVEKNAKPGGYCTSFTRNGFYFDACAHSLGGLGKEGWIAKILKELNLEKRLKIIRHDPQDTIIAPDYKISFWNDTDKTIKEFQNNFPDERKSIKDFFDYLCNSKNFAYVGLRKKTFKDLLEEYFKDVKLKAILSLPVLGNVGLPSSVISAFAAVGLYKQFIIDGGYYPDNEMQSFPDILAKKFKELGGELLVSNLVTSIKIKNNCAEGIKINEKNSFLSKYVISNADVTQTFVNLIEEENPIKDSINKLKPSLSMFILYLGTDGNVSNIPVNSNIWYLPNYDIDEMYSLASKGEVENLNWYLMRLLLDKKSILAMVNAPFKSSDYWKNNKKRLIDIFIKKMEHVIPDLSNHVVMKDAATPNTLYKWTLNYKGATCGWDALPSQFAVSGLSQITTIKNLYLTGHWTTLGQGIPGVVYLGHDMAGLILKKEKSTK